MSRQPVVRSIQCGLIGLAVLLCGAALPAAEIRDDAGFFSPATLKQANQKIQELEKKHQTQIHIETHATVPEADRAASANWSSADRRRYFDSWISKRAAALNARGVFILICKEPPHLAVETEKALQARGFSPTDRAAVQNTLISNFKNKEHDRGLTAALGQLESGFKSMSAPKSESDNAFVPGAGRHTAQPASPSSPFGNIGMILLVVVGGLLAVGVLVAIFRAMAGSGQPGYGGGMGGGGGFMSSMFGSIAGVMAGSWLYNSFFGNQNSAFGGDAGHGDAGHSGTDANSGADNYQQGDFGSGDFGGDDFGGGDFGGGDGGGDF